MTALLVLACNSKGTSSHKQDAGVEVGAPTDSNGAGGGAAGAGGGTSGGGGATAAGGAIASGGKSGAGGATAYGGSGGGATGGGGMTGSGGSTGSGGITSKGGTGGGGSGGMGTGGAGGGPGGIDASVDKPKPTMGTPCGSQSDCGSTPSILFCLAPGESVGCGACRTAADQCLSDADCVPDGGSITGKMICIPPASTECYCYSIKRCLPGCRTDGDCGTGQACNSSNRCEKTCVAGDGTCAVDFACDTRGFCRRITCTSDGQCSVACVNGACYGSRGVCQAPAA